MKTPIEVLIIRDIYQCGVVTDTVRNNVCKFETNSVIKITNGLNNRGVNYKGTVSINFFA